MNDYNGDIIRLNRLIEFIPSEHWEWDFCGNIDLEDISNAIHDGLAEIPEPYGDYYKHPVIEHRQRSWHIGRIIYFINNPMEIRDIEIDNECDGNFILPQPVIVDGWHRYAAARWLYDQGKLNTIHCRYGGRIDILNYLKGEVDDYLEEAI